MKRVFAVVLLALVLVAGMAGCSKSASKQGSSVAVIDPQQVFNECDRCLEAGDYLKNIGTTMQDEIRAAQDAMRADPTDENKKKFQDLMANYQTKVQTEQQRVVTLLNDAFTEVLDEYRQAHGFEVVLPKDGVVSFDKAADITAPVVAALNAKKVDLKLPETAKADDKAEGEAKPADDAAEAPKTDDKAKSE